MDLRAQAENKQTVDQNNSRTLCSMCNRAGMQLTIIFIIDYWPLGDLFLVRLQSKIGTQNPQSLFGAEIPFKIQPQLMWGSNSASS